MENLQDKYNLLVRKYHDLLEENKELKSILHKHGIYPAQIETAKHPPLYSFIAFPPIQLSLKEKVALFRSLFKGRDDVFARRWYNSVFVDDDFLPYQDQWSYLYQIKKVDEHTVDVILSLHKTDDFSNLTTSSDTKPWMTPIPPQITAKDFIGTIEITKADKIYIPLKSVSSKVINHLKRIASFKNPEFYCKQAMRFSTYSTPRIITCADIMDDYIAMPRGCEQPILNLFKSCGINYRMTDKTNHGVPIKVEFNGKEREMQLHAITTLMQNTCGVLSATTAFGKTVTAASLIARRRVNTLVLVHTKALLAQWHEKLSSCFLIKQGLPVTVVSTLTLCCCIIDKSIVWYGNIPILGYTSEKDNIIKVIDSKLSNELIGIVMD